MVISLGETASIRPSEILIRLDTGTLAKDPRGDETSLWFCDGPDWADPHNAPACTDASPADPDGPPRSSNHVIRCPHQWEPGRLKGLPPLPGKRAIESGVPKRKTTEETTEKDEDDRTTPDVSGGSKGRAEPSTPFECCGKKKSRKPAVPIGDEENSLRGAGREYPPRFRRRVAEAGAWEYPEQG
ncbi:hypothetical protein NDU88_003848 [Pleurodeles waltl]|uniref:Uncharacterized protein n=1 Tax=Pleurodeles waltl TaxID=8319 RepID=A0AAV7NHV0_PLEWA|nr:hypothetical protein NDU88_003848 [Pleurodeles waltl]